MGSRYARPAQVGAAWGKPVWERKAGTVNKPKDDTTPMAIGSVKLILSHEGMAT